MKINFFISIIVFILCFEARSEMRLFPLGALPTISLKEAINIMDNIVKKTKIEKFNPRSADLFGGEKINSGAWNFTQWEKDGGKYRFVVYFPEDICLILDENDGQKIIGAFKKDGSSIKLENVNNIEREKNDDPFLGK